MGNKLINKYVAGFFLVLTLTCVDVVAQDTLTGLSVEQKSYQLYQDKKWKDLVKFGNSAIKEGYNYFYIQMRVGIAYFEKKQYCLAEPHFKKALSFSANDELAQEYLYYCYVYMGRNEDARMLSKHFSKELATKTGVAKQSAVGFVMFEGGTKVANQASIVENSNAYSFKSAIYMQFGISNYIKKRISLFHAFTYFKQNSSIDSISGLYGISKGQTGSLTQLQYYIKAAIPIKNNWMLIPSFHYANTSYNLAGADTLWPFNRPHRYINDGPPKFEYKNNIKLNYLIGSIGIQKTMKKIVVTIGTTFSQLLNNQSLNTYYQTHSNKDSSDQKITKNLSQWQFIHFGSLYYSPFGNSKLVLGCTGYVHTLDSYKTTNLAISPFVYFQPIKMVSVKLSCFYNKNYNIIEDNGYLINNSPDLTKSRYSILANFAVSKWVTLYGLYQLEFKEEFLQKFNYRYNVIVAGIKIIPTRRS